MRMCRNLQLSLFLTLKANYLSKGPERAVSLREFDSFSISSKIVPAYLVHSFGVQEDPNVIGQQLIL